MPEGPAALTNAERQAGHRARHRALQPQAVVKRPPASKRRSRAMRWNDAVSELIAIQAECAAWHDVLPDSLRDSAAALQDMIDLDLDSIAMVQPPRGYGRD